MRGVPLARLERRFMFKQIASTDFVSAIVGSLAAIAFARAGYTVGALVAQQVAMILTLAVMLFIYARWLPRFRFSPAVLRPLAGYGTYVTLAGILYSVGPMINRPLISNRLSTADLGYLTIADQLIMTPVRVIGSSVNRVTFPLLSSIQSDDARIVAAHQNSSHALALTVAPIVIGIAALAEPITVLLLGPGWATVTVILALYAPRALTAAVGELNSSVFSAKGQARFQFIWGVFSLAASIGVLLLSLPYGVEAVAFGQLATSLALVMLTYTWFLARLLGTNTLSLLKPMARPLVAAAAMGALVYLLDQSLSANGLSILFRAIIGSAAGGLCYLAIILLIDRPALRELWGKVRAARKARAG
jgi:O-antigen/teichoic acid export membrane protein